MHGCHDDAYFDRLARHIDDNHYRSTACRKGAARERVTNLAAQRGLAPRLSTVPSVDACSNIILISNHTSYINSSNTLNIHMLQQLDQLDPSSSLNPSSLATVVQKY
jgi:hypothetical protein